MHKYMIFEVGNEDPLIYTKEDILKELSNMGLLVGMREDELIEKWVRTYRAIKMLE